MFDGVKHGVIDGDLEGVFDGVKHGVIEGDEDGVAEGIKEPSGTNVKKVLLIQIRR